MLVVDPLSTTLGRLVSIQSVLRSLSAQEGCDGSPYDEMMTAAEYIDDLERRVCELTTERLRLMQEAEELLAQLRDSTG